MMAWPLPPLTYCRMHRDNDGNASACFVKIDVGHHDVKEGEGAPTRSGQRLCQ
jgi:hypothetical protein